MEVSTITVVDKCIADEFRQLVKIKNNGRIHGKLRPEFERAIQNHIELMKKELKGYNPEV